MDLKDSMYYIPARRQPKRKRVAIYARVSSNTKNQLRSLANQVSALTQKVSLVEDWRLVDIYIDVASAKEKLKREEFNRLIVDCRNKKVTIVLTKSVSRFGRDTIEALETVRLLKELKVRIIFEKENINTLDSTGEVLITIMASLAQQESESLSKNIKLGLQYRYQEGQVKFNTANFLGYDADDEGNLIINQEQAKVVKRIFREYLEGKGTGRIARGLMDDKIPTGSGKLKWSGDSINRIISNEKYMGDALLQKTYTVDYLTKVRVDNDGTVPQYYIENNHEPIVSKETFHLAQQEKARRSNLYSGKRKQKRVYQGKYSLSGKVICEHCGDIFRRVKWNSRGSKATVWRCVTRLTDHTQCQARTVKEDLLHEAVLEAINEFIGDKGNYLKVLEKNITQVLNNKYDETAEDVDNQLHDLQKQLYQFANQKEDYERIAERIFKLRERKQQLLIENATNEEKRRRLSDIKALLKTQHIKLEDYDESLVNRLVAGVVIKEEVINVELKTDDIFTIEK